MSDIKELRLELELSLLYEKLGEFSFDIVYENGGKVAYALVDGERISQSLSIKLINIISKWSASKHGAYLEIK